MIYIFIDTCEVKRANKKVFFRFKKMCKSCFRSKDWLVVVSLNGLKKEKL